MIYITGASGRLGKEVLKLVPNAVPLIRESWELENGKICSFTEEDLKNVFSDADVVIHLAGSMNFLNEKELWETNVELTRRVVNSIPKNAKIIFASSISVYGKKLAEIPANEKTETRPNTAYAKSKLEAEKIVANGCEKAIILRIGTIYGPGFDDYYKILKMIQSQKMSIIGKGDNRISFVHVQDVAMAIANAINAKPGVYVISGESLPQSEIYSIAAKTLGVTAPVKRVNKKFALFFAWFEETKSKISGVKPKITREHIGILSSDRVFDCSNAERELGFKPRKLKIGIEQMVKELTSK